MWYVTTFVTEIEGRYLIQSLRSQLVNANVSMRHTLIDHLH